MPRLSIPSLAASPFCLLLSSTLLLSLVSTGLQAQEPSVDNSPWPAPVQVEQLSLEEQLDNVPSAERLADWHDRISAEPHVAGSVGDRRLIEKLAGYMESMGLDVEVHPFTTYLSRPISAELEIVAAPAVNWVDGAVFGAARELPIRLPLKEKPVAGDDSLSHPDLDIGWNAYSGSGEVTAPVVYVNYGTREDFHHLRRLGVSLHGKIALARYGGNFRGFKAKFAQEEGAVGLVIFTDPKDAGYGKGATYPQGGWANASYIQRGSLKTLPYSGDPLTPFEEATADAQRLDPETVALPRIPVQPIGWGAAFEILRRMTGRVVPASWQGGLPVAYRMGNDDLELRLKVEQERRLVESANVLGFLRGARQPDQWIVTGSHHDAWSFGAGDPNAGTILVLESARVLSEMAAAGHAPDRTLVFAHWGAEEFGIIGSTEWVEGRRDELLDKAVGYVNLDGAAMGVRFSASSSPSLKTLVADVLRQVPQARKPEQNVFETWVGNRPAPPFGNLGGGSDHVGFYCHLGIPSVNISAGGSPGVSYHSNYENLAWYRKVVGKDYAGAVMLTRIVDRILWRLSKAPLLPLNPVSYGGDLQVHLNRLENLADKLGYTTDFSELQGAAERYRARADEIYQRLRTAVDEGRLADEGLERANRVLLRLERGWLHEPGLPERPWFRNLFAATDPYSGYGAWMLPALRWVVESEGRPVPPPVPKPVPEPVPEPEPEPEVDEASDSEASSDTEPAPQTAEPKVEAESSTVEAAAPAGPSASEPAPVAPELPPVAQTLSLEEAEALYLDALVRLDHELDQLQALLPGEIVSDENATDDGENSERDEDGDGPDSGDGRP